MFRFPDYSGHEELLAPLRRTAQLWRLVAGAVLAVAVYLVCSQAMYRVLFSVWGGQDGDNFVAALVTGATPLAMYALLFSFAFMAFGVIIARIFVHRCPAMSLIGAPGQFLRHFRAVLVLVLAVNAVVMVLPPWESGGPLVPNLSLAHWLTLLPVSLLAVLVQVGSEEIVFRGYLQQQLAARFRSPLVWMVLPSVLFGLGHYLPQANGENAVLIALWAAVFGLLAADLTARTGTLGAAIALHFVNNVSAILLVSLPDELSGLSLYLSAYSSSDTELMRAWLPVDFGLMIVSWLAARLALRR